MKDPNTWIEGMKLFWPEEFDGLEEYVVPTSFSLWGLSFTKTYTFKIIETEVERPTVESKREALREHGRKLLHLNMNPIPVLEYSYFNTNFSKFTTNIASVKN